MASRGQKLPWGLVSHVKVNFQFPQKHSDGRYSHETTFISVQVSVMGEKLDLQKSLIDCTK